MDSSSISDIVMQLPVEFIRYTHALMGDQRYEQLAAGLASTPPTSIRLHPLKADGFVVAPTWTPEEVAWCHGGHYLNGRPHFTFDPLFHAGAYYVQDASSMFIDQVIRQHVHDPSIMLDLCAAPGGKSTAALSALPAGSLLFANEPIGLRAQVLAENIVKYGHPDVVVTNNYPADYEHTKLSFDIILADVPCSGEGMFRKDEQAIAEWSVQNVEKCSRLQREIVKSAWSCLREGGLLIYSTCTLNTKENEENILWAIEQLGATPVEVEVSPTWGITGALGQSPTLPVYRFIPGFTRGEGLFMAVLQKGPTTKSLFAEGDKKKDKDKRNRGKRQEKKSDDDVARWLKSPDDYFIAEVGNRLIAIPRRWQGIYEKAQQLRLLHAGVNMGQIKGRDLIPSHALALSTQLSDTAFPKVELDYDSAIDFLCKSTITLPNGAPKGYNLLTYLGLPIGFVKNLGNRSNNLLPSEWKIRSTHRPQDMNEILTRL